MIDRKLPIVYIPIFDGLPDGFRTIERPDGVFDIFNGYSCPVPDYNATRDCGLGDAEFVAYEPMRPRCKTCRYYGHGERVDLHVATDADTEPDRSRHGACTEGGGLRWVRNDGDGYCDWHSELEER